MAKVAHSGRRWRCFGAWFGCFAPYLPLRASLVSTAELQQRRVGWCGWVCGGGCGGLDWLMCGVGEVTRGFGEGEVWKGLYRPRPTSRPWGGRPPSRARAGRCRRAHPPTHTRVCAGARPPLPSPSPGTELATRAHPPAPARRCRRTPPRRRTHARGSGLAENGASKRGPFLAPR